MNEEELIISSFFLLRFLSLVFTFIDRLVSITTPSSTREERERERDRERQRMDPTSSYVFFSCSLFFSSFLMLESNPISTTTTSGFTNITTPPTSSTIANIFTPEQVACVCEVLQQSNDIQRLGKFTTNEIHAKVSSLSIQVIFYGHYQHVNIFIITKVL